MRTAAKHTEPRTRTSYADLWTPTAAEPNRSKLTKRQPQTPRQNTRVNDPEKTTVAPVTNPPKQTPGHQRLKGQASKRLRQTTTTTPRPNRNAIAPNENHRNQRPTTQKHHTTTCEIVGFPLVLHTSTISMLFNKKRNRNATGPTRTFR